MGHEIHTLAIPLGATELYTYRFRHKLDLSSESLARVHTSVIIPA